MSVQHCNFLYAISKKTSTDVIIHNKRIENLPYIKPSFIISRALAPTSKLVNICLNYCKSKSYKSSTNARHLPNLLFLKGKKYQSEIDELHKVIKIDFKINDSLSDPYGKILFYKSKEKIK